MGTFYVDSGLLLFNENETLNRQKIYYSEDENQIKKSYKMLEIINKTNYSDYIKLSSLFFNKEEYGKAQEFLDKFNLEEIKEDPAKNEIELIKWICIVLNGKSLNLKSIKKYTMGDLNSEYGNTARYIEIAHFINKNEFKNIEKCIKLLDYCDNIDGFFEVYIFRTYGTIYFTYEKIINSIKEELNKISISEQSRNKLKCIDIINEHNNLDEEHKYTKKELKEKISILEEELNNCQYDRELCENLFDFLLLLGKEKKAITLLFNKCIDNYSEKNIWYISKYNFNNEAIKEITERLKNISLYRRKNTKVQELLKINIDLLFNNKMYEEICELEQQFHKDVKFDTNTNFNIAYSYAEMGNSENAIKYYEIVLSDEENNSAALNNLGVIYKDKGNIDKALELFNKSEGITHDDIHVRNIKDCQEIKKEKKKQDEQFKIGESNIKNENGYIINKLCKFADKANESNHVICSYYELQQVLETNPDKAQEILKTFLDKKYIIKLSNHNYATSKSVYLINENLIKIINEQKEENKLLNSIIDKIEGINIQSVSEMNISSKVQKISNISDKKILEIVKRDYLELYESFVLQNNKSVIILSGSIIEALLIHIIKSNEQIGNKIYNMDITELLKICENKRYISKVPVNLISGLKKYRNFVHPGVEIRETSKKIILNDDAANIMWSFVNWLIDYAI